MDINKQYAFLKYVALALIVTIKSTLVMAYTYDETLQDYASSFSAVTGPATLYSYQKNPVTGISSGLNFPVTWQTLSAGQDMRLKLLVPPGVDYGSIYIQAMSMDAFIGTCEGVTNTCTLGLTNASPVFWPQTPITSGEYPALTTPKIVSLVVKASATNAFTFTSLAITWHIKDPALYQAWRSARNWAGGTGDCDGLNGEYCLGTPGNTIPTPTTTPLTSITLSSGTLTSGNSATSTIIPNTGATLPSCTSSNASLVSIAGNRVSLTGTVTQNTTVIITCGSVSANLIVKAAVGAATGNCVGETADANGKITVRIALTPATGDANKTATVWVAAWLPANAFFMNESVVFFLDKEKAWKQITSPILADVAFETGRKLEAPTFLNVPTGVYSVEKSILVASGVKLYAGYLATGETEMKVVGPVWPSASCQ